MERPRRPKTKVHEGQTCTVVTYTPGPEADKGAMSFVGRSQASAIEWAIGYLQDVGRASEFPNGLVVHIGAPHDGWVEIETAVVDGLTDPKAAED